MVRGWQSSSAVPAARNTEGKGVVQDEVERCNTCWNSGLSWEEGTASRRCS